MGRTQILAVPTLALVAGGFIAVGPAQSAEPAPQCQGQPVTIAATASGQTLEGTAGADVIDTAGFASVTVRGNDGDDLICVRNAAGARAEGGAGNDAIVDEYANAADDAAKPAPFKPAAHDGSVLVGGPGDDKLTGTADSLVSYEGGTVAVTIDLVAGKVTSGTESDTITGIARFVGTAYADTFTGGPGADYFDSGPGRSPDGKTAKDKVVTGAGNDNVSGQLATIDLGEGNDFAWVHGGKIDGGVGDDDITINRRGTVVGGPGNDVITGRSDAADTAVGMGKFWLNGGDGDDRIAPAVAVDAAGKRACADGCTTSSVRGDAGVDWIVFTDAPAMRVNLRDNRFRSTNPTGQVLNVEHIQGGAEADLLYGDSAANIIRGAAGRDVLRGRGGDDVLRGGSGRDVAHGGDGNDVCRSASESSSC